MPRLVRTLAILLLLVAPAVAFAQTTVRVTVERASIWRPGFLSVVTVVGTGTELDVVGRQGDWLEVVVPAGSSEERRTGLIALRSVTLVSGTLPSAGAVRPSAAPAIGFRGRPAGGQASAAPSAPPPPLDRGVRAFADVSFQWFTARDTFKAVFDHPGGAFVGGGGELRLPGGLFVQGAIRWFRRTGERVFVFEDEVFRLGIPTTVTITPIAFTGGYRFRTSGAIPYVGGGAGTYYVKERSDFAAPGEDVDDRFTSYHVLAGAEWRTRSLVAAAIEAQYTMVPDGLTKGLADIYDERDLGGFDLRFKIVFGR